MRILHTSDWHIGRQFHNVSLIDDQRHILDQMIHIVKSENIDVVLVAGDIYDRSIPPAEAMSLLNDVINCISGELNIPIIMISGNHDHATRILFGSALFAKSGVHILGELTQTPQPVLISDLHGDVAFYGIPYADPIRVRDELSIDVHTHGEAMRVLTEQIKNHNKPHRRCVVLSHCFIDGSEESDSERPLSIGGIDKVPSTLFRGFDYVALGHLHAPQRLGVDTIRYSGSILKYSFSEIAQKKSVTIVDMDASGNCQVKTVPLIPLREMRIVEGELDDIVNEGRKDAANEDYLLVRLMDTQALYEPMAKLRNVYPNVLQMEKPNLAKGGERERLRRESMNKGELPLFLDFYQQMTGDILDKKSQKIVSDIVTNIHKGAE